MRAGCGWADWWPGPLPTLGEASPQDHGETLLRVWTFHKLDFPGQRTAIWFRADLIETNPIIAVAIHATLADAEVDPERWLSAVDGLMTASPLTTDYRARVNRLVELEESAAPALRPQIETARKRLFCDGAESASAAHR